MTKQRSVAYAALAVVSVACSPMNTMDPTLEIVVSPRSIRNDGQVSKVTLSALDEMGKAGAGSVRIRSTAGNLTEAQTLTIADGTATTDFSCNVANDMGCRGTVRLSAEWVAGMRLVETTGSVTVTLPVVDAGADAGSDAGSPDGGPGDGGLLPDGGMAIDAGMPLGPMTFDGGFSGAFRLVVTNVAKPVLLEGTADSVDLTFQLLTNSTGMVPVAMRPVTLTASIGSFSAAMDQPSATLMTNAMGQVTGTVHVRTATRGPLVVVATAEDAQTTAVLRVVKVETVEWFNEPTTRTTLAVLSTGMGSNTPIFFRLLDPMGMPIAGVDVDFAIAAGSAAGCTVAPPRDRSNATGLVRTTLTAGDSQGTATVLARVLGRIDTPSTNINIVIGRVSEGRIQVTCARNVLGVLQTSTPPRIDQRMNCTANFSDRNGRNPPFALNVSWLAEAGSIPPQSQYAAGATGTQVMFDSAGNLPVATNPFPVAVGPFPAPQEPSYAATFMAPSTQTADTTVNPRDNFVTIVAAVSGEEMFWDGSGSSAGVANGTWDPGEYWVDLPEPFADSNDNGTWDPGEPFIDNEILDCATGQRQPRNARWDPANGCWDANTQVWRPTHVVYSAGLSTGAQFLRFTPVLPNFMAPGTNQQITVTWTDRWFNRLSHDSASISVGIIGTGRGTASIPNGAQSGELSFGHNLSYLAVRARVTDAGVTELGPCDFTVPDSGFPTERCLRTYKYIGWLTAPSTATLSLTAPTAQTPFPDGGAPPATTTTFELRGTNGLQSTPTIHQFQVNFP
jgi:hypothetical protein